jgi:uncharacterized protein with ParB-like and HNH nuclease domain
MRADNYKITQYSVSSILGYVENSQIAIPEIQRPFVWKGEEVRALIDSLYEGYPIGSYGRIPRFVYVTLEKVGQRKY